MITPRIREGIAIARPRSVLQDTGESRRGTREGEGAAGLGRAGLLGGCRPANP